MQDATQSLRGAFGSFLTGVTVVTAVDSNGNPVGFTANSFTSVSLDPPLLLVCPGNHLHSFEIFESVTHFAVSVLAEGQESVSNTFASEVEDRFADTHWTPDTNGTPLIDNACATFSCCVHQRLMAGDHMVLIGEVQNFKHFDRSGLGYGSNGYFSLSNEQQSDTSTHQGITGIAGAIIKSDDKVLVVKQDETLNLPSIEQGADGARSALQKHFDQSRLEVSLGPVYSIYDDNETGSRYTWFLGNTSVTPTDAPGVFTPIDSLDTSAFHNTAVAIMMERFVTETRQNVFGLYVGDAITGDVHHQNNTQD